MKGHEDHLDLSYIITHACLSVHASASRNVPFWSSLITPFFFVRTCAVQSVSVQTRAVSTEVCSLSKYAAANSAFQSRIPTVLSVGVERSKERLDGGSDGKGYVIKTSCAKQHGHPLSSTYCRSLHPA